MVFPNEFFVLERYSVLCLALTGCKTCENLLQQNLLVMKNAFQFLILQHFFILAFFLKL